MKLIGAPKPGPNPALRQDVPARKGRFTGGNAGRSGDAGAQVGGLPRQDSLGQAPPLELDDGTTTSETVAICRYVEELQPEPWLFARTSVEKAQVDMWARRMNSSLCRRSGAIGGTPIRERRRVSISIRISAGPTAKPTPDGPRWLDRELSDERSFIAGEQVSMADICVLSTVDFAHWIGCRSMRTVRI